MTQRWFAYLCPGLGPWEPYAVLHLLLCQVLIVLEIIG